MHRSGAYEYLLNEQDKSMLKWLKIFKSVFHDESHTQLNIFD